MPRTRTPLAVLVGATLAAAVLPVLAAPADAIVQSQSVPLAFSGDTGTIEVIPQTDNLICDDCIPDEVSQFFGIPGATAYGGFVSVDAAVSWEAPAALGVAADDAFLEEGSTLPVTDSLVPLPGTLTVHASYTAALGFLNDADGADPDTGELDWAAIDIVGVPDATFSGTLHESASAPCVMPLPGEPEHDCLVDFGGLTLISLPILPGLISVDLNAHLTMTAGITADGLVTVREAHISGGPSFGTDSLEFHAPFPATVEDPIALPCGPAGKTIVYDVGTSTYDTTVDLTNTLSIQLAFNVPDPFSDPAKDLFPLAQLIHNDEALTMTADGDSLELGQVQPDATAPTLSVPGPLGGPEGDEIPLAAIADDACGAPSLAWQFSDGGTAYGATPVHEFADNGLYSGQVTATDFRGNTTTKTFNVSVGNVAPNANAGPDTTEDWGVPVAFNGAAVDPSSADMANLHYAWSFGDGSPSATGGPNVTHAYATAGDYVATLSVCDDEGACDPTPDTRIVHVTRRATTLAYTGARAGNPKKTVVVSASATDELGLAVPGRTVQFTMGTQTVSATTGANGVATATLRVDQKNGAYTMTAGLVLPADEGRYLVSTDSVPFTVGK
jgi:PKD repeat protein